jgi:EpsD family peptidyl-prolyl cis-trans isomerase
MTYCRRGDRPRRAPLAIGAICAAALSACTPQAEPNAPAGQVIAHLGPQVVTSLELSNEMRDANVPAQSRNEPAIVKQVLSELVLRKYLVQQALAARLDQQPEVLLDIMRAREQVLARASMARKSATISVDERDIERFIRTNPDKFKSRHIFTIDQVRFALGPGSREAVAGNRDASSLDEIERRLTGLGIAHNRSTGVISEADLPADLGKALAVRKPDQVFFGRLGANGLYFSVKSEQASPLEGAAADEIARETLKEQSTKEQYSEAAAAALKEAKFEGEYAKIMSMPPATQAAPPATDRAPAASATPAVSAVESR